MNKPFIALIAAMCAAFCAASAEARELDRDIAVVQQAYRGAPDLKFDFTQSTYVKVLDRDVMKRGRMFYKKGGMFRIEYDGKGEKHYLSDGEMLWVFVPGDDATLVTYRVDDETVPREALSFLSGFDNLKKDFRIERSKTFSRAAPGESAMFLKPKSGKAHFTALDARFNERGLLVDLKVYNKSGNVSDYRFTNITTSAGLDDKLFTFGEGKATPSTLPR